MAENSIPETADGYVRRNFGISKGAETIIRKVWQGHGMGGGSGILIREQRILVYWDGDRVRSDGRMNLCG